MKPNPIDIGQPAKGIATVTNENGADIYDIPNGQVLQNVPKDLYLPLFSEYLDNGNDWYEVTLLDGNKGWLLANNNATIQLAPIAPPLLLSDISQAIITIDPGHGGSATGAVNSFDGFQEKVSNLAIALKLREILLAAGVQSTNIWMSRNDNDTDVSLAYRSDLGTASGGHLFVSIHNNGSSITDAHGTETYYQCGKEQTEETKTKSKILATRVQQNLLSSLANNTCGAQPYDRGVKCRLGSKREDYYYVLRNTFIPAVLTECVFTTNEVEGKCLESTEFQLLLAEGIYNGIRDYLLNIQ